MSNYYIIAYLNYYIKINKVLVFFLFIIAVIIAPIALNITEALPNGTLDYGFKKLHKIFAGISFLFMILFELISSLVIILKYKNRYSTILLIISLLEILFVILPETIMIKHIRAISQWNLMITLSLWFIFFGIFSKKIFNKPLY